jgi:hypothetical protein
MFLSMHTPPGAWQSVLSAQYFVQVGERPFML